MSVDWVIGQILVGFRFSSLDVKGGFGDKFDGGRGVESWVFWIGFLLWCGRTRWISRGVQWVMAFFA